MGELINQRIDQLELGTPSPGDYGLFRDMVASKTKRYFIPADTSDNFEWDSVEAAAGNYDTGDVVTYGGNWYQSTTDSNLSVPGTDATWTLLTKAVNWSRWAAGVFSENDVFVIRTIDGEDHIVQLVDAARPYVSSNFDTEYAAGDWKSITQNIILKAATLAAGTVELDANFLKDRVFNVGDVGESKTWTLIKSTNIIKFRAVFQINGGLWAQTFPADWQVSTIAGMWDDGTKTWTPTDEGFYELDVTFVGAVFYVKLIQL